MTPRRARRCSRPGSRTRCAAARRHGRWRPTSPGRPVPHHIARARRRPSRPGSIPVAVPPRHPRAAPSPLPRAARRPGSPGPGARRTSRREDPVPRSSRARAPHPLPTARGPRPGRARRRTPRARTGSRARTSASPRRRRRSSRVGAPSRRSPSPKRCGRSRLPPRPPSRQTIRPGPGTGRADFVSDRRRCARSRSPSRTRPCWSYRGPPRPRPGAARRRWLRRGSRIRPGCATRTSSASRAWQCCP